MSIQLYEGPRLKDVGEDKLLKIIRESLEHAGVTNSDGLMDDVAIIDKMPNGHLVFNVDAMVEGTHFRWWDHPLATAENLGRKIVAINASDFAAKGAVPHYILLTLGLNNPPISMIKDFYRGLGYALTELGARLIGGDTVRAPEWTLSVTMVGESSKQASIPFRSNSKKGHFVYTTGSLGGAYGGLQILEGRSTAPPGQEESLVLKQLCPVAKVEIGRQLVSLCPDLAMMDLSDGLVIDASRLAEASSTRIILNRKDIPVAPELSTLSPQLSEIECALYGGEDYQLLFTTSLNPEEMRDLMKAHQIDEQITCIGYVVEGEGVMLDHGDEQIRLDRQSGFQHFTHGE